MSSRKFLFSVYDSKAGAFGQIVTDRSPEVAARAFSDAMLSGEIEPFAKWPEDFDLYQVAEFDEESGVVIPSERTLVITGADVLRKAGRLSATPSAGDADPSTLRLGTDG